MRNTLAILIKEQEERMKTLKDNVFSIDEERFTYPDEQQYYIWCMNVLRYLNMYYPNDCNTKEFERLYSQKITPEQQKRILATLVSIEKVPSIVPVSNNNGGAIVNITNTNIQHNTEIIQQYLTDEQIEELKKICTESNLNDRKKQLIDKLVSFGNDVISNILSGIIINTFG